MMILNFIVRSCASKSVPTYSAKAGYAGHSKWQNIRHIKAANDHHRSTLTMRIASKIKLAVRIGGSADPKANGELARAIAEAYANDVPKLTIEGALKQALSSQESGSRYVVEAKGPGGCFFMLDCFTDRQRLTRDTIQNILKKHGGTVLDSGSISYAFEEKGLVSAYKPSADLGAAEEDAIQANAEEVDLVVNESGRAFFQFVCDPFSLNSVRDSIQKASYTVSEAAIGYVPKMYQRLTDEQLSSAVACIDKLEETVEALRKVYDNIDAA